MKTYSKTMSALALAAAMLATAGRARGQTVPDGWKAVADEGDAERIRVEAMEPGWHLSAGPAALIYDPSRTLGGTFHVEYDAYSFDGEPTAAYGIFMGGRGLEPASYDFFEVLLDDQGRFSLGHRAGAAYHEVVPWTKHAAINVATSESPGYNRMVLDVSPQRVALSVNGEELTAFAPPAYARFEGIVGLRVTKGANVHVSRFEVTDAGR